MRTSDSDRPEPAERQLTMKTWLSGLLAIVLLALALAAVYTGYPLFGVAAVVLSVFAVVEMAWLHRSRP